MKTVAASTADGNQSTPLNIQYIEEGTMQTTPIIAVPSKIVSS